MPLRIRTRRPAAAFLPWSLAMAAVLGGCTPSVPLTPAPVPAAAAPEPAPAAPAPVPAAAPAPAAPPAAPARIPDDGTVAQFQGAETALPSQAVALLEAVAADRTQRAWRWEIKGYSNRSAQANAREVALARAWAARKVLVERGVPPQQIKVLYSTEQAREAVTLLPQRPAAAVPPAAVAPAAAPAQPPRKAAAPSRPAPAPAAKAPAKKAVAAHKPKAKPAAPSRKAAAAHKSGTQHPKKVAKAASSHSAGAPTGR